MEFHSNCGKESNDRKTSKVSTVKRRNKLGSILNVDEYNDFHPQGLHYADKSKGLPQKQQVERKSQKSDELVMYMSCLPSYLEREENPQDKHFNIGVLDWRLLQKWQHNNNGFVGINTEHSPSTSNTTSISSIGSSSYFSADDGLNGTEVIHKEEALKDEKQVHVSAVADRDFSERRKSAMHVSRNDPGRKSESSKGNNNRLLDENRGTFYGECSVKAAKSRSNHTQFCSVACECGNTKESRLKKTSAKEIRSSNCQSISPSRMKNLEKMHSGSKPRSLAENESFQRKVCASESTKVRNPSPTRRFSFGISRIGKSKLVSEDIPDSKVTCSNTDNSKATSRARSSPLRRLLDPILKPKGVESRDVSGSSEKNPSTTDKALKSSKFPAERTSDLKNGALPRHAHALLQVAMKNGVPLFTFTVDNCSDILAATVKELSSGKTTCRWIYTFFSFSEMKRKNDGHWINQGSKGSNHGYIPNIIAQMKVSDILHTDSSRREFVLSSVGAGDVNQTFPDNELAAIVVKFPERMSIQRDTFDIPQVRNCSNSGDESAASDDLLGLTVILPGGHHGAPSKGEPSPLIERWKSGGLCDCGGWDLGCRLQTLTNKNESNQQFKSTKSQSAAFKLFSQDEVEEQRPVFVLSPFEDGIFSIEFSSSLKPVQAFSIGIAVVHSRTSGIVSSSNMFGGTMSEEIIVSKIFNQAQLEVSAKYAANPPLSPVGRV